MEVEGEGMVAVVQALRNAGLAVTILDGRQRQSDGQGYENNDHNLRYAPRCDSTIAAQALERDRMNHSAQIQDDRYASSYQISHCRVVPSSPPPRSTEFPYQKSTVCPYQGNFETGGYRHHPVYHPVRDDHDIGSAVIWPNRGRPSIHAASISRGTDAFAESLRKYPSYSPERATSADVIQRLLVSTQAKYLTKSSYHTRSMRSLIKKSQDPPKEICNGRKSSKNMQIHIKARQESPTRDMNVNTTAEAGCSSRANDAADRKPRNLSPRSDRNLRRKDKQIDAKYDYLKSRSHRVNPSRATEVHYLDDLSKCVRETLRHIYEDQTIVCPRIASRYSQHRRMCPGYARRPRSADSAHTEVQTSSAPRTTRDVSSMARCQSASPVSQQSNPPTCFYCQKPLPCSCGRSSSFLRRTNCDFPRCFPSPPTCKFNLYQTDEEPRDDINKKIEDLAFEWLKGIPVTADYSPEDKAVREQMVENLADALKQWIDDPNFEDMAKVEAIKCLTYMPMWHSDKIGEVAFKNQLAADLLSRLKDLNSSRFDEEIAKWVNGLNFKAGKRGQMEKIKELFIRRLKPVALNQLSGDDEYRDSLKYETRAILDDLPLDIRNDRNENKVLNELADKLVEELFALPATIFGDNVGKRITLQDQFKNDIQGWLSEIPKLANAFHKDENQQLVQKVSKKLADLQKQGLDDEEIKEEMKKETRKLLDSVLKNEDASLSPKAKLILTENLLNKLTDTIKNAKDVNATDSLQNEFKENIMDILEEVPELADAFQTKENQVQVQKLAKKLADLQEQGLDDEEIREEMKKETKKMLAHILDNEGASVSAKVKDKLTDNLLNKLSRTAKKSKEVNDTNSLQNEFKENTMNALQEAPELADAFQKKENQQQVQKLAKKLADLQEQGLDDEEIREEMEKETKKMLAHILDNEEVSISAKVKDKLTNNLLNKLTRTAKKAKEVNDMDSLQNEFKENAMNMLQEVPELADAFQKKENQQQVQKLAKKLANLQDQGLSDEEIKDKMKKETRKLLDIIIQNEDASLSPKAKSKLTKNLLNKLICTPKKAKNTHSLQNEFKGNIINMLKEVPELDKAFQKEENQQQVQKLAKKLAELQEQGFNDEEIREQMKKETMKILDHILDNENASMSEKAKAKLTESLLGKLEDTAREERVCDAPEIDEMISSTEDKQVVDDDLEDFAKYIEEWFNENSKIPRGNNAENRTMIFKLAEALIDVQYELDDEEIKELAITDIKEWLDDIFAKKGKRADEKLKDELAEELINKLQTKAKRPSIYTSSGVIRGSIVSAVAIDQLDMNKEKGRKHWSKQTESQPGSEVEDSKADEGENKTESRGRAGPSREGHGAKPQSPNGRRESKNKNRPSVSMQRTSPTNNSGTEIYYVEEVKDDNSPGRRKSILSESKTNNPSKPKRSISIIIQEGMDKLNTPDSGNVKDEIVAILHGKGVPDRKAQTIADRVIKQAKARQKAAASKSDAEKTGLNSAEIKDILNDTGITNFRDKIARSLADFLSNEIVSGKLGEQTRGSLHDILINANFAEEQAEAATDALMTHARRISQPGTSSRRESVESERKKSTTGNGRSSLTSTQKLDTSSKRVPAVGSNGRPSLTPMQEQAFQESAEQEISDFIADHTGDLSPREQHKVRRVTELLAENIKDFVSDPNATPSELRTTMENKIREFLKQVPLDTDVPEEVLINQLINKLENQIPSSPRKARTSAAGRASLTPRQGQVNQESQDQVISVEDFSGDLSGKFQVPQGTNMTDEELVNPEFASSTPRRSSAKTFDPKMSYILGTNEVNTVKSNEQCYFDQLYALIDQWITELPIDDDVINNKDQKDAMVRDLASDIVDRQKYLQLNPDAKTSNEEEMENLKYQVFKWLNKMTDIYDITPFLPNIADLMDKIRRLSVAPLIAPSGKLLQDEISKFVQRVNPAMFTTSDKNYRQRMIKQLGERVLIDLNNPNADHSINTDISLWMANMFNASQSELNAMADELKQTLKKRGLLDNVQCARSYKKPSDTLYDIIEKWCEDLPIYGGESPEEQERIKTLKQNLSSKLINKVAELNLNPEVLNDDFLYEDLLIDEIDMLLDTVPKNPELQKYLPALKRDLVSQIKEARHKIMNELAGQAYRHQLRDVVSTSIRLPVCLSSEEQASFEILRDNLVDAFINLHYFEYLYVNEEEIDRLKNEISNEINRFCNEYLRRHPRSPINPKKLNQDLYNTLRKVPVPKDTSMRSEVEELRIKDVINEWAKSLSLKDETGWELVQRNKTISVLARRLHEIEKEKESNPDFDNVGKILEEIYKWLKKCPFKPGFEGEIPRAVEKLIELLRVTKESRKFDPSRSFSAMTSDCFCPSHIVPAKPSCTFSLSDRLHLQKIRERVHARCPNTRDSCASPRQPCFRDAFINPQPIDTGSQTDVRPWSTAVPGWNTPACHNYPSWAAPLFPKMTKSSSVQATPPVTTQSQIPYEITPNVIVKEYVWDSNDSSQLQGSCQLQSPCNDLNSPSRVHQDPQLYKPLQQPKPKIASSSPKASMQSQMYSPKPSICKCCNPQSCTQKETKTSGESSGEEFVTAGTSRPRAETTKASPNPRQRANRESKAATAPGEESEWSSFKFPEDTDFWGSCSKTKRYICRKPMNFEPFTREREKREEKLRCKCRERVKYSCGRAGRSQRERSCDEAVEGCSKCGGRHCPNPSYLYFRYV